MPLVPFNSLSDDSRVWVFAADPALDKDRSKLLLELVDDFLGQWVAHGEPLTCGREWRDGRFLVVGVDQNATAYASGCSIDGLYRKLAEFQTQTGASLLSRDRVFYRDASGEVRTVSRDEFAELSESGTIGSDTIVYDTSVSSLGDWRQRRMERG